MNEVTLFRLFGSKENLLEEAIQHSPTSLQQAMMRDVAIAMLLSALLADALARDDLPGVFTMARDESALDYAHAFLATLGLGETKAGE